MAKCIKNPTDGTILRVDEVKARNYVKYGWEYVSKAEWKAYNAKPKPTTVKLRRV